jgi:hypothetical protein
MSHLCAVAELECTLSPDSGDSRTISFSVDAESNRHLGYAPHSDTGYLQGSISDGFYLLPSFTFANMRIQSRLRHIQKGASRMASADMKPADGGAGGNRIHNGSWHD